MKFNHQLNNTYSYGEYVELVNELVENHKTTGKNQSDILVEYTSLNRQRIKRLDKTVKISSELSEKLENLSKKQRWIVLTEAWCGDAAQTIPLLAKMANESDQIDLQLILRDENPLIMNDFLTNGAKSIPKLIALDEDNNVLYTWGPRPHFAQEMLLAFKNKPDGRSQDDFTKDLHTWYSRDRTKASQEEFLSIL